MRIKLNEFWMGIITNLIAAPLIAIGTGIFGVVYDQPWPVIAGLVLSAFGTVISLYGLIVSERRATGDVNNDELKHLLRSWLDNFGMASKLHENEGAEFEIAATDYRGLIYSIYRSKKSRQYLTVSINQGFSAEQAKQFHVLPPEVFIEMNARIMLDVARAKIGFNGDWPNSFVTSRLIPITTRLSEVDILNAIVDVESAAQAVGCSISLTFLNAKIPFPVNVSAVQDVIAKRNELRNKT